MKVEIKVVIDFKKLEDTDVLQLISDLSQQLAYRGLMCDIQESLYYFLKKFEVE